MRNVKKELLRKGIHTAIAVCFAIVSAYISKEFMLGIGFGLLILFILLRLLHVSLCVHNVTRITFGELFFAIGVVVASCIALPNVVLFQLSMMILAFSDPLAALIGMHLGKHTYTIVDEVRSYEGSLTCMIVSLCILLCFNVTLPIALLIASILSGIEAMSLRGSDNLFLPTSTVLLFQFFVV